MYCEKCGKKINPEDKFCGSCGTAINSIQEPKENVFEAKNEEMNKNGETNRFEAKDVELNKVKEIVDKAPTSPTTSIHPSLLNDTSKEAQILKAQAEGLGMKWYKFLIYFALFFTVFSCIVNCVSLFTGAHYDALVTAYYGEGAGGSELIYQTYPGIKIVDRVYGALGIIMAVVTLIMRSRLAKFKTKAAYQYIIYLLIFVVLTTAYDICSAIIIKSADFTLVGADAALVARFFLEKLYFSKREHLFVN